VFGFAKVRYRGLTKNTHRLLATCALANLFMTRRHRLRYQQASCVRKDAGKLCRHPNAAANRLNYPIPSPVRNRHAPHPRANPLFRRSLVLLF
jgi:hypothetical protein